MLFDERDFVSNQFITIFIATMHCIYLAVHVFLLVRESRQLVQDKLSLAVKAAGKALDGTETLVRRVTDVLEEPDVGEDGNPITPDLLMCLDEESAREIFEIESAPESDEQEGVQMLQRGPSRLKSVKEDDEDEERRFSLVNGLVKGVKIWHKNNGDGIVESVNPFDKDHQPYQIRYASGQVDQYETQELIGGMFWFKPTAVVDREKVSLARIHDVLLGTRLWHAKHGLGRVINIHPQVEPAKRYSIHFLRSGETHAYSTQKMAQKFWFADNEPSGPFNHEAQSKRASVRVASITQDALSSIAKPARKVSYLVSAPVQAVRTLKQRRDERRSIMMNELHTNKTNKRGTSMQVLHSVVEDPNKDESDHGETRGLCPPQHGQRPSGCGVLQGLPEQSATQIKIGKLQRMGTGSLGMA
jgi:hypothetical protein